MKSIVYLLVLILLVLTSSCDLFKPDEDEAHWINSEAYDFPIYVGDFGGYVHTDANANVLGNVNYDGNGDGKDWQVFAYDTRNQADLGGLPQTTGTKAGTRDSYNILVKAIEAYSLQELAAVVYLGGNNTSFFTPHTFAHQGTYDPTLEDSYSVAYQDYDFSQGPEVSFDPETNTYTYTFTGFYGYEPPWNSFTATLTEQGQVLLAWVTWSETEMLGFRLYRSDSNDISTAELITNELIPATNTSQLDPYTYTDQSVIPGHIYYYWLEYVYTEDSSFQGPVYISITPAVNGVSAAFPNPCQGVFYLSVDVKVGTTATMLLIDKEYRVRKSKDLGQGYQFVNTEVGDLEPGLYRVFIWFSDGHYAYGDVLVGE
jgi:hypothetical protein